MKRHIKTNRQTMVFATIATIVFMLAANLLVFGQSNYKVGDKIEVLYSKSWYEATIVEAKDGQFKIHYDDGSSDEWVKTDRMRPIPNLATPGKVKIGDKVLVRYSSGLNMWDKAEVLEVMPDGRYRARLDGGPIEGTYKLSDIRTIGGETTTVGAKNEPGETTTNKPDENQSAKNPINPANPVNKATKYKPGDRVECDKASIGIWEKGTVVPFLPDDTNKNSGNFYRVRLDSFNKSGLYKAGHECRTENIRPIGEAPIKASGKYKVGDKIEAQNANLTWLPGKIIAVEGAFYKVSFDNRDSRYDESVGDDRIRPLGTSQQKDKDNATQNQTPKPTGSVDKLPGTAWSLRLYRKSKGYSADGTVMTMLFCPDGTWDTVRYGLSPGNAGAVGQRGTYKVAGKTLTLKNGQGGQTESYTITWLDAKTVELSDGSDIIWRLFDGVKSDCK